MADGEWVGLGAPPGQGLDDDGLLEPGNIDLAARPVVQNDDGSFSTVRSMSIGTDDGEALIPTVSDDGRLLSDDEAVDQFRQTGRHLGRFASPDQATAYALRLHDQQAEEYGPIAGLAGPIPAETRPPGETPPGNEGVSAPPAVDENPEAEAALVRRSRSMGPRPRLLDRQAAPLEAPDLAATGNALGQSAVSSTGAAVAGVPLAAGAALRGAGRALATAPQQILGIYDAVEAAEERDGGGMPVGAIANVYRQADRAARDEMRARLVEAQRQRDEAGTGQGLQDVGRTVQGAGAAVSGAVDRFAQETFPVAPEREGDFAVRSARAAGALPAILGAGAVAGPAGVAGVIGSQTYATTFNQARDALIAGGVAPDEAEARAADAATANALVQTGLMTVPFVRLLDRLGPAAQREVLGTLRSMALSGAEFSGSNAVGRVIENALARAGYDGDRDLMHEVRESLGPEAFVGAMLPAGAAGARAAANAGRRAQASPEVRRAAADLEAAAEGVRPGESAEAGIPESAPREAYQAAVARFAEATGLPPEVRLRVVDALRTPEGAEVDARYDPAARLIEVAMDTDPALAASRVFHEGGGHVALEFATPRERMALERAADRWLAQPPSDAAARPGAAPEAGDRTNLDYIARLNRLDLREQAGRDLAREEAIAHLAEMHFNRSLQAFPLVTRALDRISDGIARLGSALRGEGFVSADSVFRAMTGGRRPLGDAPAVREGAVPAESRRDAAYTAWHGTPHVFAPEREVVLGDGQRIRLRAGQGLDPALRAAIDRGEASVSEYGLGRFDFDRIGTGEGAQAYGHGLYFADNRLVAESYRRDLPMMAVETARTAAEDLANNLRGAERSAAQVRRDMAVMARQMERDGAPSQAWQSVITLANDPRAVDALSLLSQTRPDASGAETTQAVRAWRALNEAVEKLAPTGSLYEVGIHADPGRMLDWDRSLADQPANVRAALDDIGVRDTQRPEHRWADVAGFSPDGRRMLLSEQGPDGQPGLMRGDIVQRGPGGPWEARVGTSPSRMHTLDLTRTAEEARALVDYQVARRGDGPMRGARAYLLASAHAGTPARASAALRERGVPGIRFLDGMSRDGGTGTRNTTTFSDDVVEILGRYSVREGQTGIPGTYSALARAVDKLQPRATGRQYLAALRNAQGVKAEEMAWTGLDAMLDQASDRRVTREEVQEWLRANDLGLAEVRRGEGIRDDADEEAVFDASQQVLDRALSFFRPLLRRDGQYWVEFDMPSANDAAMRRLVEGAAEQIPQSERFASEEEAWDAIREEVTDRLPGDPAGLRALMPQTRGGGEPVKYAGYQVDAGTNYGEVQILLPRAEPGGRRSHDYQSGHWSEPNVLAHVRFNEREDAQGRPVLFLEELQSDWHQAGRERGYAVPAPAEEIARLVEAHEASRRSVAAARRALSENADEMSRVRAEAAASAPEVVEARARRDALLNEAAAADAAYERVNRRQDLAIALADAPMRLVEHDGGGGLMVSGIIGDRTAMEPLARAFPVGQGRYVAMRLDPTAVRSAVAPMVGEAVVVDGAEAARATMTRMAEASRDALVEQAAAMRRDGGMDAFNREYRAADAETRRLGQAVNAAQDAIAVARTRAEMSAPGLVELNERRDMLDRNLRAAEEMEVAARNEAARAEGTAPGTVPDAPFRTSWPALIVKRMLAQAARNGQDVVAWTDGQMQAQRWGAGSQAVAHRLVWNPQTGRLLGYGPARDGGYPVLNRDGITSSAMLREAVGLDAATRLEEAARGWQPTPTVDAGPALQEVFPQLRQAVLDGEPGAARQIMRWAAGEASQAATGLPGPLRDYEPDFLDPALQRPALVRERRSDAQGFRTDSEAAERQAASARGRGDQAAEAWYTREAEGFAAAAAHLEAVNRGQMGQWGTPDPEAAARYEALREWAAAMVGNTVNRGAEVTLPDHAPVRLGERAQGMQGFYDKRLPAEVARLVKPFGGEVRSSVIRTDGSRHTDGAPRHVYAVEITPRMREALSAGGFPLFSRRERGARDVERAAARAADPSPAQAAAGNYRKGSVRLHGLPISIETAKGGTRRGVDADGQPWESVLPAHYGYVRGTRGRDGDAVDLYLGPAAADPALPVFVVDQVDNRTGRFDEHKALLGFPDEASAVEVYDAAFSDGRGPERRRAVTSMSLDRFRRWVRSGAPGRGPVNRDRRPVEARASGGRVGYADGGAVGQGGPLAPVEAPAAPAVPVAPVAPQAGLAGGAPGAAPNVGAGAVDPETRGALQGVQMWKIGEGLAARKSGLF